MAAPVPRQPRLPILLALVCALFLRALVPAGWMPVTGGGAFAIAPCPSAEPTPIVHSSVHHHGQHDPAHKYQHAGDCAFSPMHAGFASADHPASLPPPRQSVEGPITFAAAPAFKTGPPALPPPATGPPALA